MLYCYAQVCKTKATKADLNFSSLFRMSSRRNRIGLRRQVTLSLYFCVKGKDKGKCKGLDTCYSATYMSQTRDQQRFTISEVAADWHEK